nr:putative nuclease HARBI1 [Tanacetum cinerariifolium]
MFVDEDGKSLSKADFMVNADSDSEVKDVFNKTVGFMTSTSLKGGSESGDGTKSLAIDGTHVRVRVPNRDAPRYRGRKGYPTINVLVACTFDLKFTYVSSSWEGTVSDLRIVKDALTRDDKLIIPDGKYYLVDGGLPHRSTLIAPYRGVRYHLKEYSGRAPQNPRELFNLRHSSLRNSIERAFGVLKNRDKELEDEVIDEMLAASHDEEPHGPRDTDDRGEQIRNSIANDMWIMGKNDGAKKNETDVATTKKESFLWNEQMDVAFIEAMLKEQNTGNRPNETFSPHAYNNMVKALSGKFNITFDKDKLKNRIKTLKKYFNQFHDVFQGVALSGYAWNSSTMLIEAEDDVWEALKKIISALAMKSMLHHQHHNQMVSSQLNQRVKKRKVVEDDPSQDKIVNSLDNIVHALDRNSKVIENSRPHVYTEGQIYEELRCLGLERKDIHTAYAYLLENPVKTRGLFGCPIEDKLFYLKAITGLDYSEDSDTRG